MTATSQTGPAKPPASCSSAWAAAGHRQAQSTTTEIQVRLMIVSPVSDDRIQPGVGKYSLKERWERFRLSLILARRLRWRRVNCQCHLGHEMLVAAREQQSEVVGDGAHHRL